MHDIQHAIEFFEGVIIPYRHVYIMIPQEHVYIQCQIEELFLFFSLEIACVNGLQCPLD